MLSTHGPTAALDLNLLVALDALLAEGHVTRAARRAGLSQPAMSRQLARLREHFADPLLVRAGRAMELTPRARALAGPLRGALAGVQALLLDRPGFAPASAHRTFVIAAADYALALFLPLLHARLVAQAPHVDVSCSPVAREQAGAFADEGVDFVLGPQRHPGATVVWRRLFHESFVVVLRKGHPLARGRLDLDRFVGAPQVSVSPSGRPGSPVDDALAAAGRRRRIALRVPDFLVVPQVLLGSDLVAVLPARLARRAAAQLPLVLRPLPFRAPDFDVSLGWHERFRHDAGHAWFRQLVADVAAEA